MRYYATQLRAAADDLDDVVDRTARSVENATFEAPAGDRARERVGRLRLRGHTAAIYLRALANEITFSAGDVERALRDWELLQERLRIENERLEQEPTSPEAPR